MGDVHGDLQSVQREAKAETTMIIANICGPPGVVKTQTRQKHYVLTATHEAAVGKGPVMEVKDNI